MHELVFFHEVCGRAAVNKVKWVFGLTSVTRATLLKNTIFAAKKGWRPLLFAIHLAKARAEAYSGPYAGADIVDVTGAGALTDGVLDKLIDGGAALVRCTDAHRYFKRAWAGA